MMRVLGRFCDPGGNRLAMRVSDPATGEVQSITRYNYFTREVHQAEATSDTPGTPRFSATLAMDYEGRGMDKLFSTLTYYPANPDRVDVVEFGYSYDFYEQEDSDITSRIESTYVYNEGDGWHLAERASTGYTYENGSLVKVAFQAADYCPSTCEVCGSTCTDEVSTSWDEYYAHDVFGRRIAISHKEDGEETTSMYDYAGPSNQVLAVRLHRRIAGIGPSDDYYEDPFVSTYTHGPLGVITQTEEGRNADPADNRDHYVLEDLMGGHNVLAVDHDGDSATDRLVSYQTFHAFGNVQKKWLPHTATFAWRGSEGSKTDTATNLVEMGARTYDPTLGRFLQADALPMASGTSQGMNRYIYCENDPVNASDPSGHSPLLVNGLAYIGVAMFTAGLVTGMWLSNKNLVTNIIRSIIFAILGTAPCTVMFAGATPPFAMGMSLMSYSLVALGLVLLSLCSNPYLGVAMYALVAFGLGLIAGVV